MGNLLKPQYPHLWILYYYLSLRLWKINWSKPLEQCPEWNKHSRILCHYYFWLIASRVTKLYELTIIIFPYIWENQDLPNGQPATKRWNWDFRLPPASAVTSAINVILYGNRSSPKGQGHIAVRSRWECPWENSVITQFFSHDNECSKFGHSLGKHLKWGQSGHQVRD